MPDTLRASTKQQTLCPACGGMHVRVFFEQRGMPVFCNVLYDTRDEALNTPHGDIRLAFCDRCGMIHNVAFDPDLLQYTAEYENALDFSPRFRQYADELQQRLIDHHDLRGKHVLEIGCGKGDFLQSLCDRSGASGIGYDPSYEGPLSTGSVEFMRDCYHPARHGCAADLVICRHVLEHIADPRKLLRAIRHAIGDRPDTAIFFEVPNALYTLRDLGIWDIIYEHCGYFSASSLVRIFAESGFTPRRADEVYGGQFVCIEATAGGRSEPIDIAPLGDDVAAFMQHYIAKVAHWNDRLSALLDAGRHVAVWGAGSKGVTLLNTLKRGAEVQYVIDVNPRKVGMHVAGSGQCIDAPSALPKHIPLSVLVMNPLYESEIRAQLADLGITADVEMV